MRLQSHDFRAQIATMICQSKLCIGGRLLVLFWYIAGFEASWIVTTYEEGDAEEIKRASQSSDVNHLDHVLLLISLIKTPLMAKLYMWCYIALMCAYAIIGELRAEAS